MTMNHVKITIWSIRGYGQHGLEKHNHNVKYAKNNRKHVIIVSGTKLGYSFMNEHIY